MKTKVSIIIPVYNTPEDAFLNMYNSIVQQTYSDYEIIIIDDGSKRKTRGYLDKIADKDGKIKLFHTTNGGVSKARNYGFEKSIGEYIVYIDADDLIEKSFLEQAVKIIEQYDADVVYGIIKYKPEITTGFPQSEKHTVVIEKNEIDELKKAFIGFPNSTCNFVVLGSPCGRMFKRSVLENIRYDEDMAFNEDQIFNRKVLNQIHKAVIVPYIWYYYNQNEYSAIHSLDLRIYDKLKPFWDKWYELSLTESAEVMEASRASAFDQYTALISVGYANDLRNIKVKLKQMKQGSKHPYIQDALKNINIKSTFMNSNRKLKFFLLKMHLYFPIFIITYYSRKKRESNSNKRRIQ